MMICSSFLKLEVFFFLMGTCKYCFSLKKKNPRLALAALECRVMNGNRNCALVSGPLSQHAVFGVYSGFIVHPFLLLSVCQYVVYRHTTT